MKQIFITYAFFLLFASLWTSSLAQRTCCSCHCCTGTSTSCSTTQPFTYFGDKEVASASECSESFCRDLHLTDVKCTGSVFFRWSPYTMDPIGFEDGDVPTNGQCHGEVRYSNLVHWWAMLVVAIVAFFLLLLLIIACCCFKRSKASLKKEYEKKTKEQQEQASNNGNQPSNYNNPSAQESGYDNGYGKAADTTQYGNGTAASTSPGRNAPQTTASATGPPPIHPNKTAQTRPSYTFDEHGYCYDQYGYCYDKNGYCYDQHGYCYDHQGQVVSSPSRQARSPPLTWESPIKHLDAYKPAPPPSPNNNSSDVATTRITHTPL